MAVSINNVINVNIADLPSIMELDNINVIGLFTKEIPLFAINKYKVYQNANSVMQDFGYNSNTYKMASSIFNQSLNILAGGGYLVIIPMLDNVVIGATSGELICKQILLDFFKEVSDGSFKISIDGAEAVAITNLDFSNVKSLDDVASVIQEKMLSLTLSCVVSVIDDNIIFTSETSGATSKIELSSDITGTDLTTLNYLNISQAESIDGKNGYTGAERIQDAYSRSKDLIFYEAIITSYIEEKKNILELANMIQAENKISLFVFNDLSTCLDCGNEIKNKSFTKTRILFYSGDNYLLFLSGYISKALSINFSGVNTVYNLHIKEIVGIEADDYIDDDKLAMIYQAGVDCYCNIKGVASIYTSGENDFIDNVVFKNWLKNSLEVNGFNCLRLANVVPQTEEGVDMLKSAYEKSLKQGQTIGYISKGGLDWNLPIYLGTDKELFLDNIKNIGYFEYSLPINEQQKADRDRRKAPFISLGLKLSGAINSSDVLVYVNY